MRFVGGYIVKQRENNRCAVVREDFYILNGRLYFGDYSGARQTLDLNGMLVTPCISNGHVHLGESHLKCSEGEWNTVEDYIAFGEKIHAALTARYPSAREAIEQAALVFAPIVFIEVTPIARVMTAKCCVHFIPRNAGEGARCGDNSTKRELPWWRIGCARIGTGEINHVVMCG